MEVRESKPLFMQEVEILASNTVDEKKPIYISKAMRRRAATAKRQKRERWNAQLGRYNPAAGYMGWKKVNGEWVQDDHVKYPKNSKKQRYWKRQSNKAIRRSGDVFRGNQYRKCLDYWCKLY